MRSIQGRFNETQLTYPNLGTYICLARAVTAQNFSLKNLKIAFNKLVSEEDYVRREKKALIENLFSLSNQLRRYQKVGLFAPGHLEIAH
jgi:hypothetical protein